jgi:hypothetical protein
VRILRKPHTGGCPIVASEIEVRLPRALVAERLLSLRQTQRCSGVATKNDVTVPKKTETFNVQMRKVKSGLVLTKDADPIGLRWPRRPELGYRKRKNGARGRSVFSRSFGYSPCSPYRFLLAAILLTMLL